MRAGHQARGAASALLASVAASTALPGVGTGDPFSARQPTGAEPRVHEPLWIQHQTVAGDFAATLDHAPFGVAPANLHALRCAPLHVPATHGDVGKMTFLLSIAVQLNGLRTSCRAS